MMTEKVEALQVARSTAKDGEGIMDGCNGALRGYAMSPAQTSRQQFGRRDVPAQPPVIFIIPRSTVRWCDGQKSKIRMQDSRGKISGNKIGDSD
jgi:hypothetical protein